MPQRSSAVRAHAHYCAKLIFYHGVRRVFFQSFFLMMHLAVSKP
jgi:hypothetical protein